MGLGLDVAHTCGVLSPQPEFDYIFEEQPACVPPYEIGGALWRLLVSGWVGRGPFEKFGATHS